MLDFEYNKVSAEEAERRGTVFCKQHGDRADGIVADSEFDLLFDHLAMVLRRHGTFVEGHGEEDFSGYRYVDQIPWITIVPSDAVSPATALTAGLEAVVTAHRPVAVSFDFFPEALLILPPNIVHTTFERSHLSRSERRTAPS